MREKIFEEYSVRKAVLTLAAPTILGMLVTVIYNLADTYFIGMTDNADMVAAVSLSLPLFFLLMSFGNLFGVGGATYISRLLGLKEYEKIKHVSTFCFYGMISLGVFFSAVSLLFLHNILNLLGTSPNTYLYAKQYVFWITAGAPFVILQHSLAQIIRSEGASKEAMIGMVLGTILNIILDPIMIITLGWGPAGAAIATVIGNISSVVYYIIYLKKANTHLSISLKDFKVDSATVAPVLKIGFPSMLNTTLIGFANILLYNFAASYGDVNVAAIGITSRIIQVPRLIIIGLSLGTQPFVGYNYAAKNFKRMNNAIKLAGIVGIIFGSVSTLVIYFNSSAMIRFFINDAGVIEAGSAFLKVYAKPLPIIVLLFIFLHSIQAFGKAIPALILAICRDGLIFLPVIYLLDSLMGMSGVIWAMPIADLSTLVLAALLYLRIYNKSVPLQRNI